VCHLWSYVYRHSEKPDRFLSVALLSGLLCFLFVFFAVVASAFLNFFFDFKFSAIEDNHGRNLSFSEHLDAVSAILD
jgi:hypothetical protein